MVGLVEYRQRSLENIDVIWDGAALLRKSILSVSKEFRFFADILTVIIWEEWKVAWMQK